MPANQFQVEKELKKIKDSREVFAIIQINGEAVKTLWSQEGGSAYAHDHAEYKTLDVINNAVNGNDIEEGERLDIEITLKWSPCHSCANQLADVLQIWKSKYESKDGVATLSVYYLDLYRGQNTISPENMAIWGITCKAYEKENQIGVWWVKGKKGWQKQMG